MCPRNRFLAESLGKPISQGRHSPISESMWSHKASFQKHNVSFIHTFGVHNTSKFGAKLHLLRFRAISHKVFPMGPVFMTTNAQDPRVDSVRGGEDDGPLVLAHQPARIELLGDSLPSVLLVPVRTWMTTWWGHSFLLRLCCWHH